MSLITLLSLVMGIYCWCHA